MEAPKSKRGVAETTALLLLALLTCTSLHNAVVSADQHVVGDKKGWAPGVNYTIWADRNRFLVGDWLVFYYQKGYYDVMQVNETAYDLCSSDHPIANWSRGRSYVFQLNETKRYYFICSRGYCYNGMKLSVVAEPLPSPAPEPAPPSSAGSAIASGRRSTVWAAVVAGSMAWAAIVRFL